MPYGIVRTILDIGRYRGRWQYGATDAVWQNKADYSRSIRRARLPWIDDRRWAESQRRMAGYRGGPGRAKTQCGQRAAAETIEPLCVREGQRALTAGGKGNAYLFCPDRRTDPAGALVSILPRRSWTTSGGGHSG